MAPVFRRRADIFERFKRMFEFLEISGVINSEKPSDDLPTVPQVVFHYD